MYKTILLATASSMIALPVLAADANQVEKSIELKDGSTVHIFADGKMGMESRFGRAADMAQGEMMEAKDGKIIVMNANEYWRVKAMLDRRLPHW